MRFYILSFAATLGLVAVQASAAEIVDANGNGTFSIEEVVTAYPGMTEKAFHAIDTDGTGEWSTEELGAAIKKGIIQ